MTNIVKPVPKQSSDTWGATLNQALDILAADLTSMQVLVNAQASLITALTSRVTTLEGGAGSQQGAVVPVVGTINDFATTGSQTLITQNVTIAAGCTLFLVWSSVGGASGTISGVTVGGAAMTKLDSSYSGAISTSRGVELWYKLSPATGVQTVVQTSTVSQFHAMSCVQVSNTGATPFTTTGKDAGPSGTTGTCTAGSGAPIYVGAALIRGAVIPTVTAGGDTTLGTPAVSNSALGFSLVKSVDATIAASWTGSATDYAMLVVGIIGAASSSSAPTMPSGNITGWNQIFTDDFATDTAVGTWTSASSGASTLSGPAAYTAKWSAYPKGYGDTSNRGRYNPEQCISTLGGSMLINMFYDGAATNPKTGATGCYQVAAPLPKLPTMNGGRLSAAVRVPHGADTYKVAWLWWPDSGVWPGDGEIDFFECNLTSKIGAFAHYANTAGGQDGFSTTTYVNDGAWHILTVEWISGTSIKFYLDGVLFGTSTTNVPSKGMHPVLQCETNIGGTVNTGDTAALEVAWVTVYQPA